MKRLLIALILPCFLEAQSISELFEALKSHSQTKIDIVSVKKSKIQKGMVESSLYPKIDAFASYDNYNKATGLIPIPPNKSLPMVKDASVGQPFSKNIYKAGAKFSMPIFVKSIYTAAKKAEAMQKSVEAKKYINLIKNEAIIISQNANFSYLVSLKKSLQIKEKSLLETRKTIKIKVENGRLSESSLYKIEDAINEISIAKNNIELQEKRVISSIQSITGITLKKPVDMEQIDSFEVTSMDSLKPLEKKVEANSIDLKVQKEKLYPSVVAHGSYVFSKAKAYNNDKSVNENYSDIGLVINIPLVDMNRYSSISMAKVILQSSMVELEKQRDELEAESKMLKESLQLQENSIKLYKKSIENKKKLLEIAKVNFTTGRLATEEYLRYEDAVVAQKANLFKIEAQKWQTIMSLAVIYGNNIEEMVR